MILGFYKEQKEEYAHLIQRTLQEHLIDQQTMQKEFEEMMTENPNIKRQNTPIRKDTVVKRRKMSYGAVVRNDDEEEEIDDDSVRTHHRRRTGAMTAASPFFGMGMNTTGLMMHSVLQQRDKRILMGCPNPMPPSSSENMRKWLRTTLTRRRWTHFPGILRVQQPTDWK